MYVVCRQFSQFAGAAGKLHSMASEQVKSQKERKQFCSFVLIENPDFRLKIKIEKFSVFCKQRI